MKPFPFPVIRAACVGLGSIFLTGCAATEIALEHKDLDVQTKMSATVFLDVEKQQSRTVFVDVKNTSDKDVNVDSLIRAKLQAKNYTVTPSPQDAFYILQVNILQVGKMDPSALHQSLYAGWGGASAGMAAGAAIGATQGVSGVGYGAAIGGLAGGAAEMIAGSLVKNVTYAMITDVQIMEKTDEAVHQDVESSLEQGTGTRVVQSSQSERARRKYQTRVATSANKVNLKFEEAEPVIEDKLASALAGIF
jgi:hypothetical protein